MLLQAAINGSRAPAEHPALPVHPDQLAAAAKACVAAGVGAVHFHVRSQDGRESLAAADVIACEDTRRTGLLLQPSAGTRMLGATVIGETARLPGRGVLVTRGATHVVQVADPR